jgi:hypothetical protein
MAASTRRWAMMPSGRPGQDAYWMLAAGYFPRPDPGTAGR